MMSLTFGLFTQVSGSGPLGPLVLFLKFSFHLILLSKEIMLSILLSVNTVFFRL